MLNMYTLNEAGQLAIRTKIEDVAKENVLPSAWFSEAEDAAQDAFDDGLDAVIEVGGRYTNTGNPALIMLERSWFDAKPTEDTNT